MRYFSWFNHMKKPEERDETVFFKQTKPQDVGKSALKIDIIG
jgi:hypothetical protein